MADHNIYVGSTNDKALQPTKIYVGDDNDTAQLVSKVYVGNSSNKAVQVWPRMKWTDTYQKCQYLYNSTGNPYIRLNFKPDSNTRVDIKFRFIDQGQDSYEKYVIANGTRKWGIGYYYYHWGAVDSAWYRFIFCDFNNANGIEDSKRLRKTYSASNVSQIYNDHTIKFNQSGGYFSIDGSSMGQLQNTFSSSSMPYATTLFCSLYSSGRNTDVTGIARVYIYYCKIYQANDLIYDLVPCYRKSDHKPGMYDFANDYFHVNSYPNTNDFYCGPDVND